MRFDLPVPELEVMSREELIVLVRRQGGQLAARDRQISEMAGQVAALREANEALHPLPCTGDRSIDTFTAFVVKDLTGSVIVHDRYQNYDSAKLSTAPAPGTQGPTATGSPTRPPDDVLRFPHDLKVPATSNQAERDLRPSKIQQKISGRLTSEKRTQDRYTILGYLSTATKHGLDKITVLRDALTGRLWMPALPAPT